MRTQRLLAILDSLRARRRPVSAQSLADVLGVSVRTVYRDMAALQEMGAPIRGEGGIGYELDKGFFLPPLHFDEDELEAVILGMQLVAARGDLALAKAARSATGKIDAVRRGPGGASDPANHLLVHTSLEQEQRDAIALLSPLRTLIRKREVVSISYRSLSGNHSKRTVRPLGLTVFDAVWLLTAWCELRDGFRNFRIDRLESAASTGRHFPRERGKELHDYLKTLSPANT